LELREPDQAFSFLHDPDLRSLPSPLEAAASRQAPGDLPQVPRQAGVIWSTTRLDIQKKGQRGPYRGFDRWPVSDAIGIDRAHGRGGRGQRACTGHACPV